MAKEESKIQKSIIDLLQRLDFVVINNYTGPIFIGGRMCKNPNKYFPDISVMLPDAKWMLIEVKEPNWEKTHTNKEAKKRVVEQKKWLQKAEERGGIGILATSLHQVYDVLMKRGYVEIPWVEKSQSQQSSEPSS